jgi:hypothetical protein
MTPAQWPQLMSGTFNVITIMLLLNLVRILDFATMGRSSLFCGTARAP